MLDTSDQLVEALKRAGLFMGMAAMPLGCHSGAGSPPGIGEPFPEYAAPMLDGDTVRLGDFRDQGGAAHV